MNPIVRGTGKFLLVLMICTLTNLNSIAHGEVIRIDSIIDGDTIKLTTGQSVRLLQIDTPEMRGSECYAQEARVALARILTGKGSIKLVSDPKLDQVDSYGRLLRYIFIGKTNVNLKMVQVGAATPYFYRSQLGQYSKQLLMAAENAKAKSIGLWKQCPGTKLNPNSALTTISEKAINTQNTDSTKTGCDPNYAGCIPVFPPDLNCPDIKALGLAPVQVIGRDVHRLDRDGDGIGCD